jgi:hypothetical protein
MPATSEKQRRAMYAAAAGNSKLGIPAKVGQEFVRAEGTPSKSKAHHKPAAKGFRQRAKDGYE